MTRNEQITENYNRVLEKIEEEAAELLRKELEQRFPGRELHVERDGRIFKIHGDLSLS